LAAEKQKTHKLLLVVILSFSCLTVAQAGNVRDARIEDYEGRTITSIDLVFEGTPENPNAQADLLSLLKVAPNTVFSAVRVRDSLQALFDSGRVANARVEVVDEDATRTGPVRLRFVVQRQVQIGDVRIEMTGPVTGTPLSSDEIRARLNFVQPGTRLSKQLISRNADEIQVYLRDRGYFNATVEPVEQVGPRGIRATVIYRITPGDQARVDAFNINIKDFDAANGDGAFKALAEMRDEAKKSSAAVAKAAAADQEPKVLTDAELKRLADAQSAADSVAVAPSAKTEAKKGDV